MVTIKLFKENTYYENKYGEKEYLSGENDDMLISAALLTGKGLHREEECVYCAYGDTEEEAEKSVKNYLKVNQIVVSRKEIIF